MRPHVAEQQAEICKLLPIVARHFLEQGTFPVDYFVVRERQNEILGECVDHRERQFVMVIFPVNRIVFHESQRVVHPAHIPFQIEAEPTEIDRPRNRGPRRGFFRNRQRAGMLRVQHFVQVLEEADRFEIFAAAEAVWNPFARLARVIEIEHGRDRVHAQAVEVIFVDPEQRVRNQKILHFVAAVVEDERAPVRMRAFARIGVLVKMRAIEERQAVRVAREMRGRPIENHSDAFLMAAVDEVHKIFGRAKSAGHGEISDGLIAPRFVEWMLHYGHHLDVRVAHSLDVRNQLIGELAVGEPAVSFIASSPPRTEMHFVN